MKKLNVAFVIARIGAVDLLSIPVVAALTRELGHTVALFEYGRNPQEVLHGLEAFQPDIVAYSVASNEAPEYLRINRTLKQRLPFFSLFGGGHPTYTPSVIEEEGVDAICRGESDAVLPQFLKTFGTDAMYETPNFAFKLPGGTTRQNPVTDLVPDLDAYPFPARDLVYERNRFMALNPIKAFIAGRGCPFGCAYCFNSAYKNLYKGKGRLLRTKSVSYLIAEIKDVAQHYPLSFVRFHDDVFGSDHAWLEEFAERFPKEIGLPFTNYVNPSMVNEEYVRLLEKAGCYSVCTAIECANEGLRVEVLKRRITTQQIREAARLLHEAGIRIFTFNMIGVPGETEQDMWDTIRLNREIGCSFADVSVFTAFPGTEAFDYCREHGYLREDAYRFENIYSASNLNFPDDFRDRIYVLHKFFTALIDHPGLEPLYRCLPKSAFLAPLYNLFYRFYYGYFLHRRIYASSIPFRVRLLVAKDVLFSRNRI